ncbi:MAG: uracil-DNA glycosylase [Patescibacteria group bacterium]|nr:uracil-DNA glycosylase [Patescibacteria group bacterium]
MDFEEFESRVKKCALCGLSKGRTNVVPGEGSYTADVMFIGEGPGKDEDLLGRPFVGAAGKFLTELLGIIGMDREQVYIANVVKCRPPGNRDPLPEEVETCWPYLEEQIKMIKPKLIVTLGRHSMNRFLPGLKISQVHGQPKRYVGIWQEKQIYLPVYHPAVALYDPRKKDIIIEDFKKIPLILKKLNDS